MQIDKYDVLIPAPLFYFNFEIHVWQTATCKTVYFILNIKILFHINAWWT